MIELKNLTKKFGKKTAVKDLSVTLEKGTITMLIGPSGCGKTTTLKMINRLVKGDTGDILINGKSIYDIDPVELRRSMGYVIQEVGLFPHLTVYDNIAMIPKILEWDSSRIKERVETLLDVVTLNKSYTQKYPLQLSGGERQRVGLARALVTDPDILLMDEPFGAIDPINRIKLQDVFLEIQEEIQKTIVFVTHDINEAIKLGDKLVIMNYGEMVQYGDVSEILFNPKNEFVENLLGHDRNIKALAIKRTKDFIRDKDEYFSVNPDDRRVTVFEKMKAKNKKATIAMDSEYKIHGIYLIEKKRDGQEKLIYEKDVITVAQNSNLTETFSIMLSAGEQVLPVVNKKNQFLGMVHLDDIFEEIKKSNEE